MHVTRIMAIDYRDGGRAGFWYPEALT
jgi:hypothetical protein